MGIALDYYYCRSFSHKDIMPLYEGYKVKIDDKLVKVYKYTGDYIRCCRLGTIHNNKIFEFITDEKVITSDFINNEIIKYERDLKIKQLGI